MYRIRKIKYFSPDGRPMPNGVGFQRGGFLRECGVNRRAFVPQEGRTRRAVMVLPTGSEADSERGVFFGRYVGAEGERYDAHSGTIFVEGRFGLAVLLRARKLARKLKLKTFLLKDLHNGKLYYANCSDR